MVELDIDYKKLEDLPLEEAKEIIGHLDYEHFLEDISDEVNGKRYGFYIVDKGDWNDEGKYQFRNDIGILCEYDEDWTANRVRKLLPLEYERLQTLPDNYTDCVSDSRRYTAIGNGWTVDVIAHIFSYLKNQKHYI